MRTPPISSTHSSQISNTQNGITAPKSFTDKVTEFFITNKKELLFWGTAASTSAVTLFLLPPLGAILTTVFFIAFMMRLCKNDHEDTF